VQVFATNLERLLSV